MSHKRITARTNKVVSGRQFRKVCPLVRGGGVYRWGRSLIPRGRRAWFAKRVGRELY